MILTREKIKQEIKKGNIKIRNQKPLIDDSTITFHLGNEFRVFRENLMGGKKPVRISNKTDYKEYTRLIKSDEIIINPGQLILGVTKERIKLPNNIAGILTGRSRLARMGLSVHITSDYVHPGVDNRQVLEIKNNSIFKMKLKAGLLICQLILIRTDGSSVYKGDFRKQEHV